MKGLQMQEVGVLITIGIADENCLPPLPIVIEII